MFWGKVAHGVWQQTTIVIRVEYLMMLMMNDSTQHTLRTQRAVATTDKRNEIQLSRFFLSYYTHLLTRDFAAYVPKGLFLFIVRCVAFRRVNIHTTSSTVNTVFQFVKPADRFVCSSVLKTINNFVLLLLLRLCWFNSNLISLSLPKWSTFFYHLSWPFEFHVWFFVLFRFFRDFCLYSFLCCEKNRCVLFESIFMAIRQINKGLRLNKFGAWALNARFLHNKRHHIWTNTHTYSLNEASRI